jgi:hypothetical protein
MPLSWVGRRDGGQASASPGGPTEREFRKVAAIQARTLAVGQTRKVPKRRYHSRAVGDLPAEYAGGTYHLCQQSNYRYDNS